MAEPPMKKIRTESVTEVIEDITTVLMESKDNLTCVLSQDLYKEIPTIKVYVGFIKQPKELSQAIRILNDKLPLNTLQHLKRVRKKDVLLCTSSELKKAGQLFNITTIKEFMDRNVPDLASSFEYFKEIDVPAVAPKLKRQSIEANKLWSCNFHPNSYLEQLASNNFFNDIELAIHKVCMRIAFETARMYVKRDSHPPIDNIHNLNACVVYDPSIQSVVAVSFDNRDSHPIQHSAMIAIDNVAKTQNGGAWSADKENTRLSGITKELLTYLKEKFDDVNFGAKLFRPKSEGTDDTSGPYLCTGYYIYMIREPCLMCAMALVHARVKRVFFCLDNPNFGALKSMAELQAVPFLNHHFEVFTGFL